MKLSPPTTTKNNAIMFINSLLFRDSIAWLVGKRVKWFAPAAEGNQTYGGTALISAVYPGEKHPIHAAKIEGDNLNFAFWDDGFLAYSDAGRCVDIEIIN